MERSPFRRSCYFPFDFDYIGILIAANVEFNNVKLWWSSHAGIENVVPQYIDHELLEFRIAKDVTSIRRLAEIPHYVSENSGIEMRVHFGKPGYYIWKIFLILWLLCCLSWVTFAIVATDVRGSSSNPIPLDLLMERLAYGQSASFSCHILVHCQQ